MEGFLKRCALCASEQKIQGHTHFDPNFQSLRISDDLLTGLWRKRSKKNINLVV